MIETVISIGLPVRENLIIKKNRLQAENLQARAKRISIVTGIHGDELEGQYVCYEVIRRIQANKEKLRGIVDVYPCLNPLGMDAVYRNVPNTEIDLNRMFPGNTEGPMMEKVASAVVADIAGSDMCIDLHSSDTFIREVPQVRLSEVWAEAILPYAMLMNVNMIWKNATKTVDESTLAFSLNMLGTPSIVVEMGIGNHINQQNGRQIADGIFQLMIHLGIWDEEPQKLINPIVSTDLEIEFIRANESGVFIPCIEYNCEVEAGDKIGDIIHPLSGEVIKTYHSSSKGLVFSLREYPMVYAGSLLARIINR